MTYRGYQLAILNGIIVNALAMAIYEQVRGTSQLIMILAAAWIMYMKFYYAQFRMFKCKDFRIYV